MNPTASYWEQFYLRVPLAEVPAHFATVRQSPFTMQYLTKILSLCPEGGRACEIGFGSGYAAIWLSLRGVQAEGIDASPVLVERARQANNVLGGQAKFRTGNLLHFYEEAHPPYNVIHHQDVLGRFGVPQIHAILAQQVASADWVVFSVPSVFYPFDSETGEERLLPLEEWERILAPFTVEELCYHGDPQHGAKEHILCVLRGQEVTPALKRRLQVPAEPYPPGISAIVHTRNEAAHIAECLQTLKEWTDEVILCDMESTDTTVEIARPLSDQILHHPLIANFDRARNVSAMRARYRFIFYLDADERVPPELGKRLREAVLNQGDHFEAMLIPFRHHFAGRWLQCLYPGYTAPRLLKNGRFCFNARLHSGAQVDGHTAIFPADNPDLALVHYSYASMSHYLEKLNRYTDGEAANMHRDGRPFSWQDALRHFTLDLKDYYDRRGAAQDGPHGFAYSFLSGFYRFEQHIKLFEKRFQNRQLQPEEMAVPQSAEQMLEYMLSVVRERPQPQVPAIQVRNAPDAALLVWSGPLLDPSGYGEESRHFVFALEAAGIPGAVQVLPWSSVTTELPEAQRALLDQMAHQSVAPGFLQITHNFATQFARHPQAGAAIGRTLFETDRLPTSWVQACNRMDYVWVASEFNRKTFAQAGVDPKKLVIMPECFDPAPFLAIPEASASPHRWTRPGEFTFLAVFDWTLHKGWDVLLKAFLQAFEGRKDCALLLKVWSTLGYSPEQIRQQAADLVRRELGYDLAADGQVRFISEHLSSSELIALYRECDAYVLPSRGEGWGRPYMEAMACGKPTLATGWSGNTEFMNAENSYLFDYDLVPVPEAGWREVPVYRGHRWAEPRLDHVIAQMRRVVEHPEEARSVGERARVEITTKFSQEAVGELMAREIARVQAELHQRLVVPEAGQMQVKTKVSSSGVPVTSPSVRIRWEGVPFQWHSLAHVNREACLALLKHPEVELALIPTDRNEFDPTQESAFVDLAARSFAHLSGPGDIHVRHYFPPLLDSPDEGKFVLIQPWEYGFLPTRWLEPIRENVDEVWCYSNYVRDVYLASGIPGEKLHVVPLGVDPTVFHPEAPPYVFTTEPGSAALTTARKKRFVFLFVGGTLHRKGIDILLEAYLKAFSAFDDVALVIKDTGVNTVYRGQNDREKILARVGDEFHAPLIYLEDDLSAHQLAGLYTAADCLVQPYRGEGFCLPALEAMACGIPVIVPEGGPTDDFVDDTVGWRVAAEKRPLGGNKIGEWECAGPIWMFEVAVADLARQMRAAYSQPQEAKRKGEAAARRVQAGWTWEHAGNRMLQRMKALQAAAPAPPEQTASPANAPVKPEAKRTRGRKGEQAGTQENGLQVVDRRSSAPRSVRKAPTISLCMIVKNEERVLDACLTSVKPFVDEIVLVDTGSTDRTVEIAQAHGVRLFHFPWCDDFSAARNVSLQHATGDWLYWMDADDTLPEECGRQLHEVVTLAEEKTAGILMQVHIPPNKGEQGFTVVDHVKLFRNKPYHRFEGRIHEQILEPIYRYGGQIERSNLYVVHSGYDYSPEGQKRKRERDLKILALEREERPHHPFVWFNIGMTAYHLKNWEEAVPALERSLSLSKSHESTVRKIYAMLAGCRLEMGDNAGAKDWIDKGLALFPHDPELLFRAGIVYREVGDFAAAERSYLTLLTARETGHIDSLDVSMTTYKGRHNLAVLYRDTGRLSEAEAQFREALSSSPDFVPSWLGLGEIFFQQGRYEEVRAVIRKVNEWAPEAVSSLQQRLAQATNNTL